jgi:phosphotransferase system enzyme I (PtsI)
MPLRFKGIPAAPGIAIAPLVHFHSDLEFIPMRVVGEEGIPEERRRLEYAIDQASRSILFLRHELASTLTDRDTKIYDAQLALLHDQTFKADLIREVERDHVNIEVAIQRVIARYEKVFESMEDIVMRERAADVRDVGRQVLSVLTEQERSVYIADGRDYIFAATEFLPSDAGLVDRAHLRGIVMARGGKYSHGAILARSLGIPSLVGVDHVMQRVSNGTLVILDGESGVLIAEPEEEEIERYKRLALEQREADRRVFEVRFLPSRTPDGTAVELLANVEGIRDLGEIERKLVSGIGLFRTEFAFMERRQFPTEDEQVAMYQKAIEWAGDKVVTFRTLDVGGDKPLRYFRTPDERNPVLGWRGLRISLDWPDLLYTQIRALLRASAGGKIRIMLPMVTNVAEIARCREVVEEIRTDLVRAGEQHDEGFQLGVMVEVPALAAVLDHVLPLVDFVSVGTNDLVQYLLAVDRDNPRVAGMYSPYHPAVVRVLEHIAKTARAAGRPASICGEIAGDHYFTPILIGLGYRELSMAPVFLPRVKLMVRTFPVEECEAIAAQAREMRHSADIRGLSRDHAKAGWTRFLREQA